MFAKISSIFNHSNSGIDDSVQIQSIRARSSNKNGVAMYLKWYENVYSKIVLNKLKLTV